MTNKSNDDGMFKVNKKDYDELFDLAEAIIATNTLASKSGKEVESNETLAAKALQIQIDEAKSSGTESLFFTENEVQFLSAVVS